jgi:hypothetical protein
VNKILSTAQQYELPLPARALTSVEGSYSRERFDALVYEWQSCHPLVRTYAECVAKSGGPLAISQLDEARLLSLICEVEAIERPLADEIERRAKTAYSRNKSEQIVRLANALVCCLFKLGVIGIKLRPEEPYRFCYDEHAAVSEAELTPQSKVVVHPMLQFALGWSRDEKLAA